MQNCIFTAHCSEKICDNSCSLFVETSYLLERNGISMNNKVFNTLYNSDKFPVISKLLETVTDGLGYIGSGSSVEDSDLITYCAICKNWKGSQLHCTVYNLKLSQYLDSLKQSWNLHSEPEALEYARIWASSAKVLVISNIDYVKFGDFEAQTLLNLIQSRSTSDKVTYVVGPTNVSMLVGSSTGFFPYLKKVLDAPKERRVNL